MFQKISKIFVEHDALNQSLDEQQITKFNNKSLKQSINDFVVCDKNKRNILHRAALQQNPKLIKEILTGYAQISPRNISSYINQKDKFGITPIQMCCFANYNQRSQCLNQLKEDAEFNSRNPRTLWSCAHWVAFYGDEESLKILFEMNTKFFTQDYMGYYPLDLAGLNQKQSCAKQIVSHLIQLLLDYESIKINKKPSSILFDSYLQEWDRHLSNPLLKVSLFYWSCYFQFELVSFLKFSRMYFYAPYLNMTPLHIAIKSKNIEAFRFILAQKSNVKPFHALLLSQNATPINNRIFNFTQEELKIYDSEYCNTILEFDKWEYSYLLNEIELLDQKAKFGNTPLHLASLVNNLEMVNTLIDNGCSIDMENQEFWRAEDLTIDPEVQQTIVENQQFKKKLVKSIYSYLTTCEIKGRFDNKTKKYEMLKNLIGYSNQMEIQPHLIQLYQIGETLINPDYVLKCISDKDQQKKINFQIQVLINAKFSVYLAQSLVDQSYYIMLKYPIHELQLQAMIQKLEVKLIDSYDYEPFDYILKEYYEPFRSIQRQAVIEDYLTKIINLMELKEQNLISDSYRMHSYGGTSKIKRKWLDQQRWFWPQPLNQITDYFFQGEKSDFESCTILRLYFGEKTAFFFAWKSYLTCFMLLVAVPGLALQIYLLINQDFKSLWIPVWVIYLSIWSTVCVEFWKRKSSEINARWGMLDLMNSDELKPRYEFSGDEEINLVTHEISKFEKKIYTLIMFSISLPILIFFSSFIVGLFLFIDYFQKSNGITSVYSKIIVGVVQGLCIAILNLIYSTLVNWFVEKENHKYEQHYESSLIYKNVLFKFINSYISVVFTGYIKSDSSYEELFYLLLPVLVIKQISYLIVALIVPQIMYKYKEDQYFSKLKGKQFIKQVFKDGIDVLWMKVVGEPLKSYPRCTIDASTGQSNQNFDLDSVELNGLKFQTHKHIITNYFMESMIDFGYITLFSAAFPIGPLIAMLMNILEIRMKIYSFIYVYKRPQSDRAAGIGEWLSIWELLSFLGVFSNFALLYQKQHEQLNDFFFTERILATSMMWLFILIVLINIIIKYAIQQLIPDKPQWVMQWEEELIQKRKNQSQLSMKEQECQQLYVKVSKLEKQNYKLTKRIQDQQNDESNQLLLSPEKQIDYSSNSINEGLSRSYYKNERDLLIQRLASINQIIRQKKIIILLCAECQQQEVSFICQQCQIQLCQSCYIAIHSEQKMDHSQFKRTLPVKEQMWRKLQYFAYPLNVQSPYFKTLRNAYDLLTLFYEGQCGTNQLFLQMDDFNTEDKWYLNKLMYLLYRKKKNTFSEFQKHTKILQSGVLEQKLFLFIELLDEDDDQIISKEEFDQYILSSFVQNVSLKQFPIKLFEQNSYSKKDLILHVICQIENQNQFKEYFKVLLQQ